MACLKVLLSVHPFAVWEPIKAKRRLIGIKNSNQTNARQEMLLSLYSSACGLGTLHHCSDKLKMSQYTPRRRVGERRCSCYSFSTSALNWGEWSASRPGRALAPGKGPPVPIVLEAGWAPEPVWIQRLEEKSFRLWRGSNLDRPVVQPVARHYTD
jgi:hypothetical protein